jgi:hypothetical protein
MKPSLAGMVPVFSNGGHLGHRTALMDTILRGTHPGTIPARLGFIWFSGFRGEDLNPNFAEMILGWSPSKIVSNQLQLHGKE